MPDAQNFFQRIDTLFLIARDKPEANDDFMNRIERLQHNVVRRLPDEELFTFPEEIKLGQFLIGSREQIKKFWEEPGYAASFVGQSLHPEVYEKIQKLSSLEPNFLENSWGNSNCAFDLSFPFLYNLVLLHLLLYFYLLTLWQEILYIQEFLLLQLHNEEKKVRQWFQ